MSIPEPFFARLNSTKMSVFLKEFGSLGNVSGFYRLSDAEESVMIHEEPLPELPEGTVPFLFEAVFFNGNTSVSVRQYNGFWQVTRVDWTELPPKEPGPGPDYLAYLQFAKVRKLSRNQEKLLFYTQYLPVENKNTGFKVLTPAWNAFIGFAKEN